MSNTLQLLGKGGYSARTMTPKNAPFPARNHSAIGGIAAVVLLYFLSTPPQVYYSAPCSVLTARYISPIRVKSAAIQLKHSSSNEPESHCGAILSFGTIVRLLLLLSLRWSSVSRLSFGENGVSHELTLANPSTRSSGKRQALGLMTLLRLMTSTAGFMATRSMDQIVWSNAMNSICCTT
jgi:hypothetical protein